jgi:hypothetical protein
MRRMEALTPRSMTEIEADKDLLRAEFAVLTRRLEMSIEQMKAKTTSQLAEIGKQSEAIGRSVATDARLKKSQPHDLRCGFDASSLRRAFEARRKKDCDRIDQT